MRKLLLILAATACVGVAHADVAIIDYQGYSWETGGFPASNPGDVMNIVGVVDQIDPLFNISLAGTEVTFYVTGLVSQGQVVNGDVISVSYSGGTIELWDDPSKDHDYGSNPPNASAPPSFVNGTLFLGGTFDNFFLYYDTASGAGAFEGQVSFTSGSGLPALTLMPAPGYTFGGALSPVAVGPNIPQGYDLQIDGTLQIDCCIGVEQKSWSGIKNLYRQ
jgi:hypothetical protein